uniref:protein-tyrosine-phosphatase n=1 Tax=Acanthochromis polyacanthus TaxID=80966 RepID=A0A3Q1FBD1_9TELE
MPKPDLLCLVQLLDGTIETFRVSVGKTQAKSSVRSEEFCGESPQIFSTRDLDLEGHADIFSAGLASPFYLNFRVRFFISDPNSLQHEQTRLVCELLCLKTKDLLVCPLSAAVVLASYAVQSEIGDHSPSRLPGYLSKSHFIPEQDEDFLSKVEDLHPQHKGLKQSEAELCFLNTARTLDLYGVELHAAMDTNSAPLVVGLASSGVAIFCNMICSSFFPWGNIIKISFKRKRFLIHLKRKHGETQDCEVSLLLHCPKTCKNLWRSCVDHHSFFSSNRTTRSPKYNNIAVFSLVFAHKCNRFFFFYMLCFLLLVCSGPVCQRVVGGMVWNPVLRRSLSSEHLETKSLPSRSPPTTPNWYEHTSVHKNEHFHLKLVHFCPKLKQKSVQIEAQNSPEFRKLSVKCFKFPVEGPSTRFFFCSLFLVRLQAGRCEPKLLEGDLVVLINGRDISEHTHDQVVMFIRASRESHSRELALLIRRKGLCRREETAENEIISVCVCLRGSSLLRVLMKFSWLVLTVPLTTFFLSDDATRVVLQGQEDYINASHVTVAPPVSGVCLRYVAAQGPLPQTCTHFWQTVWEQQTHTIIMLTTLTERGRTKCHQYWPHPPEVKDYGPMRVKCHSEECNLAYVTRQFTLTHTQLGEERAVTHLQYVAWPDHGVPDDPSDFLLFVGSVRERRRGDEPLMVHCSAGIGRTGVLITMETALTLLDEGRPVFPLDIVKTVRDQRAMMVQTTCQFQFVCEAILRVYREKKERSPAK